MSERPPPPPPPPPPPDGGAVGGGGGELGSPAVALPPILNRPVEIVNIRAGRKNPGLRPQHLASVRALAQMTGAQVRGAELGSTALHFIPGRISGGSHRVEIGTAGAVSLVFQMLLAPLGFAKTPSRLTLSGGTHVPWSPPSPYLSEVFLPIAAKAGLIATRGVERAGFYPRGGGEGRAAVERTPALAPLDPPGGAGWV